MLAKSHAIPRLTSACRPERLSLPRRPAELPKTVTQPGAGRMWTSRRPRHRHPSDHVSRWGEAELLEPSVGVLEAQALLIRPSSNWKKYTSGTRRNHRPVGGGRAIRRCECRSRRTGRQPTAPGYQLNNLHLQVSERVRNGPIQARLVRQAPVCRAHRVPAAGRR